MGLVNDPSCNQCSGATESASHFLCQCDRFITLWRKVWGKSHLQPGRHWPHKGQGSGEMNKEISQIHSEAIIAPVITRELQGMADGPNPQSKPTGQLYLPCPTSESVSEPGWASAEPCSVVWNKKVTVWGSPKTRTNEVHIPTPDPDHLHNTDNRHQENQIEERGHPKKTGWDCVKKRYEEFCLVSTRMLRIKINGD